MNQSFNPKHSKTVSITKNLVIGVHKGNKSQSETDPSELQLQAQCYQWAFGTYPQIRGLLWHVANEMKPHPKETIEEFRIRINKAKAAGLVKGVSDLHMFYKGFHVFELKVDYNKLSTEQVEFGRKITEQGGHFYEIRNIQTFQNIIRTIVE